MSRVLTTILSRAVSGACVTLARVVRWSTKDSYYIQVNPDHTTYWFLFKEVYPDWDQVALRHNVVELNLPCPEFNTEEDLIEWVIDVLSLTKGEETFLRLYLNKVRRYHVLRS